MAAKPKTKYKDNEGNYLAVIEAAMRRDGYVIAWWIAECDDAGLVLGPEASDDCDADSKLIAEVLLANDPAGLSNANNPPAFVANGEYIWEKKKDADAMLKLLNEALLSRRIVLDWEQKALDAGWLPPEGWGS